MHRDHRIIAAEELMGGFAARTGLSGPTASGTRYLWTDAFAVFSLLALHELTGQPEYLDWTLRLVDQVHHVLGRHRHDDARTGWISGLSETEGEWHPTCGGLRIGKRLNERGPDEPYDERLEWDRDGQYFHYLTKWMQALNCVSTVTGDPVYYDWAVELADAAHRAFFWRPSPGSPGQLYWKMSIDLSRPLVRSMGQLDALDGFVTYTRLDSARGELRPTGDPDLGVARQETRRMCEAATWITADELGIGGLLAEAGALVHLAAAGERGLVAILERVLADAARSLSHFESHHRLDAPAEQRLAFRELGLAIGLQALDPMRDALQHDGARFGRGRALRRQVDALSRYAPLVEVIHGFWLVPQRRSADTWTGHRDINSVMLATSLVPHVYLMSGPAQTAGAGVSPLMPT